MADEPEKPEKPEKPEQPEQAAEAGEPAPSLGTLRGWREWARHRRISPARLLPTSALGMVAVVLSFSVGAAFSGALLYTYYEFKKDRTERRVSQFIEGFEQRVDEAAASIRSEAQTAREDIVRQLEPLRKLRAEGETLEALVKKLEPSLFLVTTLDEAGQPSVGSGFAVASDNQQTLLLTSYTTVKAATRQPGPGIRVTKGTADIRATLWSWQEDKDLALIVLARPNVAVVPFAAASPRLGERLFAVSALGAAGGAVSQGFVADVSTSGIQHDAAVGPAFQGGPLVNSDGQVLAVSSRSYAPLGFTSDEVFFAPPIRSACETVLRCPDGRVTAAGDRPNPTPAPPPPPAAEPQPPTAVQPPRPPQPTGRPPPR